jgi:hypothetical protein
MNAGRWYPTNTTLANGDVLVVSGDIDSQTNVDTLPQVWQTASGTWRNLSTALLALPLYPRMLLAPNGKVFDAGSDRLTRYLDTTGTGTWTTVGNTNYTMARPYGSAVMYDIGKVLIVGGGEPPTNTAEIIDLNSATPSWQLTGNMAFARRQHNATVLPDGKVLVTAGSSGSGFDDSTLPVFTPEIWDPATGAFTRLAASTIYRGYHATALLLPDGRVLSAGGNVGGPNAEIYSPPYLFKGRRPAITSTPASIGYGQTFFVSTPDATNIAKVSFIRLGSVTHSFDMNQRFMRLSFTATANGLNVTSPTNPNIAPPGHYMMFFLFANGVPSIGSIVRIGANPGPLPTGRVTGKVTNISNGQPLGGATVQFTGGTALTNGSGDFTFASVPSGTYSFTATANGYLPRSGSAAVAAGTSSTLNFQLATAGKIRGTVTSTTGAVVSGVTVKISGGVITTTATLTTDTSGNYLTNWVPVGNYTVTISMTGRTTQSKTGTVSAGVTTAVSFTNF